MNKLTKKIELDKYDAVLFQGNNTAIVGEVFFDIDLSGFMVKRCHHGVGIRFSDKQILESVDALSFAKQENIFLEKKLAPIRKLEEISSCKFVIIKERDQIVVNCYNSNTKTTVDLHKKESYLHDIFNLYVSYLIFLGKNNVKFNKKLKFEKSCFFFSYPETGLCVKNQMLIAEFIITLIELGIKVICETYSSTIINTLNNGILSRRINHNRFFSCIFKKEENGETSIVDANVEDIGLDSYCMDVAEKLYEDMENATEMVTLFNKIDNKIKLFISKSLGFEDYNHMLLAKGEHEAMKIIVEGNNNFDN